MSAVFRFDDGTDTTPNPHRFRKKKADICQFARSTKNNTTSLKSLKPQGLESGRDTKFLVKNAMPKRKVKKLGWLFWRLGEAGEGWALEFHGFVSKGWPILVGEKITVQFTYTQILSNQDIGLQFAKGMFWGSLFFLKDREVCSWKFLVVCWVLGSARWET